MKGFNRPQSSKAYNYIGKKPEDQSKPIGDQPGPQSYQINYKVAENGPKGGNFGPTREKFLERQK